MSKVKKVLKGAAKLVSSVVPDELKPVVKIGLAFIPGVGPALSAGYSAVDAYGSGKSLGSSILTGAKSYAVSQVAGAASKALGITSQGNDLTDALGQTKGEGVLGLSGELSGAAKTLGLSGTTTAAAAPAAVSEASAASTAASAAAKTTTEAPGFFARNADTISTVGKVASIGSAASALLSSPAAPASTTAMAASTTTTDTMQADAAAAAEEENRRKRGNRGSSSNIFTSPLGLVDQGKSAASVLLG